MSSDWLQKISAEISPFIVSPASRDTVGFLTLASMKLTNFFSQDINVYLLRDDRIFTKTFTYIGVSTSDELALIETCILPGYSIVFMAMIAEEDSLEQQKIYQIETTKILCNSSISGISLQFKTITIEFEENYYCLYKILGLLL